MSTTNKRKSPDHSFDMTDFEWTAEDEQQMQALESNNSTSSTTSSSSSKKVKLETDGIFYKQGDLFNSDDSLVHCIGSDCRMGKGISGIFLKKFGGKEELIRKSPGIGDCV
eukprot:TRINITY_DN2542_c0_g1_i1.p1 TRINITY_DN2542_c0_g1~~TRINITY_DN2542_c0_g1_i1.p1  ORF type:complete len:111 (+),score=43.07 TRINITY_DN2542_c0_g1_i1:72-404(+)